jgi:hypothetical protein
MKQKTAFIFLLLGTALVLLALQASASGLSANRLTADSQAIHSSRQGLRATIAFIDGHPDIFPKEKLSEGRLPDREKRMVIWQCWQTFLDRILYLDLTGRFYTAVYQDAVGGKNKTEPFYYGYASFLAQYRFAMEFIERIEKNPAMNVILNEPVPELGLAGDTYKHLKFRFLNIARASEFGRLNVLYEYYKDKSNNPFRDIMEEDIAAIWQLGSQGTGPALTLKNAFRMVGDLGFTAWFPVQKEASRLMGNIKVWRCDQTLIAPQQIETLQEKLQPGDILLERREWYASNIGIPGFWAHAALYIGTADERRRYFSDPAVHAWLEKQDSRIDNLEALLQKRYPNRYKLSQAFQEDGHPPRVLEAIEEGVSFSTLEHSAAADSLAVLRPNLPLQVKALAILRAFNYSGRPYDFNFDFLTDSELVCSELIYKAYEGSAESGGLALPVSELLGRKMVTPNDIARLFALEQGESHPQLQLITFLDGREWSRQAVEADHDAFAASWKRPKWHIWMQDMGGQEKRDRWQK